MLVKSLIPPVRVAYTECFGRARARPWFFTGGQAHFLRNFSCDVKIGHRTYHTYVPCPLAVQRPTRHINRCASKMLGGTTRFLSGRTDRDPESRRKVRSGVRQSVPADRSGGNRETPNEPHPWSIPSSLGASLTLGYFFFYSNWTRLPGYFSFIVGGSLAVFALWQISDRGWRGRSAERFLKEAFVSKHFVSSLENLKAWRIHTLLTSGISHAQPLHLLVNMVVLEQVAHCVGTQLTSKDTLSLCVLGTLSSSLGHLLTMGTPVIGFSGTLCSLFAAQASLEPDRCFRLVVPISGLKLDSLQLFQLVSGSQLIMICLGRWSRISWVGHLAGALAGLAFVEWKSYLEEKAILQRAIASFGRRSPAGEDFENLRQKISNRTARKWKSILSMTKERGCADWRRSGADFQDSVYLFRLRRKIKNQEYGSDVWCQLNEELEDVKRRKARRWHRS